MIAQVSVRGNPYRADVRLRTDDQLYADIALIGWILTDAADELDAGMAELLALEREACQWELWRRWNRDLHYEGTDFGFDSQVIEQIKHALPIESVIGLDVPLRREGKGYRGKCPFHDGKSDNSLSVKPGVDGAFYCFGCNFGGDVLTWIMAINRCEFSEALRRLAVMAGEPIPMRRRPDPPKPIQTPAPSARLAFPRRRAS